MKFLFRCLVVIATAAALGIALYFAVQALPGGPSSNPPARNAQPEITTTTPQSPAPRPAGSEAERRDGFRLRSWLQVARHIAVFSFLVFLSVLGKNLVFARDPKQR